MISKCRGWNHYIDFRETPVSLKIDVKSYPDEEYGKIINFEMCIKDKTVDGSSKEELLLQFKNLAKDLKVKSKYTKEVLIIWTNNLNKIYGFFKEYITDNFANLYITLFDVLEFRDITVWNKELKSKQLIEWNLYIKKLYRDVFIPAKYFYITPNQIVRRQLKKTDTTLAKELYPENYDQYKYLRSALFGGLCYCPYPGLIIEEPMIEIDLTSAYIFDLICCKHVVSKPKYVPSQFWEYYLTSDTRTSLGYYEIKFANYSNRTQCFRNEDGYHIDKGEQTQRFVMNSIDLKFFLSTITVLNVECLCLEEYEMGYLPKDVINILVEEYSKKYTIDKDKQQELYKLQKKILNGIYGDTIRVIDEESFYRERKDAYLAPQWGIWTTSYCKKYLYELASKLDGWYYSDTDSIFCKDKPENRKLIEEFNKKIQTIVENACKDLDLSPLQLHMLGQFKIEAEIKKFRALACKEYMYTTKDDQFIVKAAGCDKNNEELDERLYEASKIPIGTRMFWNFGEDSYYEYPLKDEQVEMMMVAQMAAYNKERDQL